MAVVKSVAYLTSQAAAAVLLMFLAVAMVQTQTVSAQNCPTELANLNVCAPFVLPGAADQNPTAACCGALQAVQHDCLCNTLRIASQLPTRCNLQPLNCGN